ncbi:MAG: hypothetical protein JHD28_03275 [Bacteroidia bacterium]|nr:hypothetical protein [Bacteroidia bacterium]
MIIEDQSRVVLNSLKALLETYAEGKNLKNITDECSQIFVEFNSFEDKLKALDALVSKNGYGEIEEVVFDLMLVHFLSAFAHDEEYFDSEEWIDIEEQTVERGTELLNVFLYINEASDADAEISIGDFLNEFLLTDMDEFQDEFKIYEPLIENDLEEADFDDLTALKKTLSDDSPIKDMFIPMVMFFQTPYSVNMVSQFKSNYNSYEIAILASLIAFANTK